MSLFTDSFKKEIDRVPTAKVFGKVTAVQGMLIEIGGVQGDLTIGDHCYVDARNRKLICEVIGFRNGRALIMPFGPLDGVGLGARAEVGATDPVVFPQMAWLGRIVNAMGEPIDGKGPLPTGSVPYPVQNRPPPAHARQRVGGKIDLGVRSMNTFLTCCRGQRMGVFSGSGVGKSSLMSMMARHTNAQVSVIGLIGERGREAREFIEDDLGEEGMARSVVVVATSDEPPLVRRQAAYLTLAVSEYFRDVGNEVLCLMDSVTRFAMAQREISLSAGEPPASKGYTPTVFSELPKLLERAGPGLEGQGNITGLFTVLVEGDDHNEPVADAVRGILDGHVVLDRAIAERGRFPAINVLRSISRTMPACNSPEQNLLVNKARKIMATYEDMAELIRLGAYRRGSDSEVDEAIDYYPALEGFLAQEKSDPAELEHCYAQLAQILAPAFGHPPLGEDGEQPEVEMGQPAPQQPEPSNAPPPPINEFIEID